MTSWTPVVIGLSLMMFASGLAFGEYLAVTGGPIWLIWTGTVVAASFLFAFDAWGEIRE